MWEEKRRWEFGLVFFKRNKIIKKKEFVYHTHFPIPNTFTEGTLTNPVGPGR